MTRKARDPSDLLNQGLLYPLQANILETEIQIAARVATDANYVGRVTAKDIPDYLGPPRFHSEGAFRLSRPGVATGVAWTEVGGDVLYIEAVLLPGGGGHLTLTGQLGAVMQESARAALSHVRQQSTAFGIEPETLARQDLHIHVPAGAIPKDGPSAGVTMATAIVSAARQMSREPQYPASCGSNISPSQCTITGLSAWPSTRVWRR